MSSPNGTYLEEAAECTGIGRNTMRKLVNGESRSSSKRKKIIRRDTRVRFRRSIREEIF